MMHCIQNVVGDWDGNVKSQSTEPEQSTWRFIEEKNLLIFSLVVKVDG